MDEQQRRPLARAVADNVHPMAVLSVVLSHGGMMHGRGLSVLDKCHRGIYDRQ